MVEDSETEADWREAAKAEIDFLNEMRRMALEQHSHSFKWITASLLAVNGGAAISVLNTSEIAVFWKILAGAWFSAGILTALLVGVVSQKINMQSVGPIQRSIGYWIGVVADGERVESFEGTLAAEAKAAQKFAWLVPTLGWVSGLFFVIGLGTIAFGLVEEQERQSDGSSFGVCRQDCCES